MERNIAYRLLFFSYVFFSNIYFACICTATLYRYQLCYAQLLSLISQSMFPLCIEKSLQRDFIRRIRKKKQEAKRRMREREKKGINDDAISLRHVSARNEILSIEYAYAIHTLNHPSSHLYNYSHWLEFSVQFVMLVLLITISQGMNLFIYLFSSSFFSWMLNTFYL